MERSVKLQSQLLQKAIKLLKNGQELVYSTCSILKEENEEQIERILRKGKVEIVPIDQSLLEGIPLLPSTIEGTITICPTKLYEGFFVAKLKCYN